MAHHDHGKVLPIHQTPVVHHRAHGLVDEGANDDTTTTTGSSSRSEADALILQSATAAATAAVGGVRIHRKKPVDLPPKVLQIGTAESDGVGGGGADGSDGGRKPMRPIMSLRLHPTMSPAILRAQSVNVVLGTAAQHGGDTAVPAGLQLYASPTAAQSAAMMQPRRFSFSAASVERAASPSPSPPPSLLQRTAGVLQAAQATLGSALQTADGKLVLRQHQKSFAGNVDQSYTCVVAS